MKGKNFLTVNPSKDKWTLLDQDRSSTQRTLMGTGLADSFVLWYLLTRLPRFVLRCGHSGGLHRGVCSGCDKPPPLPAAAGPEEQQHQRGEQTQHVHGLQDRAAPPQLSQGQHEGILHLTAVCTLWT